LIAAGNDVDRDAAARQLVERGELTRQQRRRGKSRALGNEDA